MPSQKQMHRRRSIQSFPVCCVWKPHQYSTGMVHVWVNGEQVLEDGEHTGALPGRVVHGPGWQTRLE